jgi:dihydroorotase-like cyclic amidohydrolase
MPDMIREVLFSPPDATVYLPSVIVDTHCHGRDMDQAHKTTIAQTLREARRGLITTSFFMPNTDPPITDLETLGRYIGIIDSAKQKLGIRQEQYVYFGATDDNLTECREALENPVVIGVKVYPKSRLGKTVTTGTIGVAGDLTTLELLKFSARSGKPIAFHCDDPEIIAEEGNTIRAEAAYVKKILTMAQGFLGIKIVICHVSCVESAELILKAQKAGINVALELCPHYLWFDSDGTNWNPALDPVFYHCYNNLRPKKHREYLVGLLKTDNPLIFIGSDNAPHTREEKLEKRFGGLPSNQEMVPAILTLAKRQRISNHRTIELLLLNASRFFGIPVSGTLKEYKLVKKVCQSIYGVYGGGKVENPWRGLELCYPEPIGE